MRAATGSIRAGTKVKVAHPREHHIWTGRKKVAQSIVLFLLFSVVDSFKRSALRRFSLELAYNSMTIASFDSRGNTMAKIKPTRLQVAML